MRKKNCDPGGGVCKDLSFSGYFQCGAVTEKQRMHFTQAFDNHEIMVIETFSALTTLMFIEISEN